MAPCANPSPTASATSATHTLMSTPHDAVVEVQHRMQ